MLPTRKLISALSIAAAAAALAIGGLSLPWHGSRPSEPPHLLSSSRGAGPLRAGAAEVNIDLPAGVPIAGFARFSWGSTGIRDPVTARALFLEQPGCRVVIASVEILLVTPPLARRVEELVSDLGLDAVLIGATHTHAGPGGYWDFVVAEHAALGPFDASILELLARRTADAIRRAAESAAPARLAVARGSAQALVWVRSGGRVDGRVEALRFTRADGEPLAELVIFAAHPTTLGKANRRISGDWPGRFMASSPRAVRLLLQGAIGDQSAEIPPGSHGSEPERFADAVERETTALKPEAVAPDATLAVASASVTLPDVSPGAVPSWLRRAAATLAWSQMPSVARVTALRLGPVLIVAVPGEPTAEVAGAWRTAAGVDAEVASLVGPYVGYVETAERTRRREGEAVRTYYGPELADRLGGGVAVAARAAGP